MDQCILVEDTKYRKEFISKLIASKAIPELISDKYGNYGNYKILSKLYRRAWKLLKEGN